MFFHQFIGKRRLQYSQARHIVRRISNEMMSIKRPILYGDEASPPTRFVMITAQLLGVDLHFHLIDMFKGDHKTDFYKKINYLQQVPAITIDGQTICDSHVIALYLCRRSKVQELYPTDDMMRAKVDQMLYYDATTLFPIDSAILSEYFAGKWPADEDKVCQWYSAIDYLETQLDNNKWLTGDKMQLCDICCALTMSSLGLLFPPLKRHVKIKMWMENLDELSCFKINRRGLERMRFFIKQYGPALTQ